MHWPVVEQYRLTAGFGVLLQIGFDYADPGVGAGRMRSMALLARDVKPTVSEALEKG